MPESAYREVVKSVRWLPITNGRSPGDRNNYWVCFQGERNRYLSLSMAVSDFENGWTGDGTPLWYWSEPVLPPSVPPPVELPPVSVTPAADGGEEPTP